MLPQLPTTVLDCPIAEAIARELQTNSSLDALRRISLTELASVIDRLVQIYTRWASGDQGQIAECSRYFANLCFPLSIPMVEAAYALFLIRDGLLATMSAESRLRLTEFFNVVTLDLLALARC